MDKPPIESWIEKWGTTLDWEAKAAPREAAQAEKIAGLNGQLHLHANVESVLGESRIRVQSISEVHSIGELEKSFCVDDTPENRMEILHKINEKKGEIACDVVRLLAQRDLTVNQAISILEEAKGIIQDIGMESKVVFNDND